MSFNSIPVNGWPQLKELDELARKVGNIPTFTSSDKEALEDLISNAQALIDIAEDGAAGVPFDNTGTELTADDVQAALVEISQMGGGELSRTVLHTAQGDVTGLNYTVDFTAPSNGYIVSTGYVYANSLTIKKNNVNQPVQDHLTYYFNQNGDIAVSAGDVISFVVTGSGNCVDRINLYFYTVA